MIRDTNNAKLVLIYKERECNKYFQQSQLKFHFVDHNIVINVLKAH